MNPDPPAPHAPAPHAGAPHAPAPHAGDRAGVDYWSRNWSAAPLPPPVDPADRAVRPFARYFEAHLGRGSGRDLLEVGAAHSVWLPYFARQHGFRVAGLDYSAAGCDSLRAILLRDGVYGRENVDGAVHHGDLFDPPADLVGRFDAVCSFGVVEHFDDTAAALRACGRLLKPGGTLVTSVPNMAGLVGRLQRVMNRRTFDLHVPLDLAAFTAAHRAAGLAVRDAAHLGGVNLNVVNTGNLAGRAFHRPVRTALSLPTKLAAWRERRTGRERTGAFASPYLIVTAGKHEIRSSKSETA